MKFIIAALIAVHYWMPVPSAEARDVPLIRLTCEDCNGVEIPLGLTVANNNPRAIMGVYYIDDEKKRQFFPSAKLREMTAVYEMAGYDVALIQLATHIKLSSALLRLKYVVNALRSTYSDVEFNIRYNAPMNMYQVINPETKRPVSEAYIIPNTMLRRMVGISRIDMR